MDKNFNNYDQYVKVAQTYPNTNTGRVLAITDLSSGGALTAVSNYLNYNIFKLGQTTSSQTVTLTAPADTATAFGFWLVNSGSAAFTVQSVSVAAGKCMFCLWDGDSFAVNV